MLTILTNLTIFDKFDHFMTILDNFWTILTIETIFDKWKDSPGDSTFETLSTILTIENLNSDNHSYLTINCDTGQHSQFLRCFQYVFTHKYTATPFSFGFTGFHLECVVEPFAI